MPGLSADGRFNLRERGKGLKSAGSVCDVKGVAWLLGHSPCAGPAGWQEAGRSCLAPSPAPGGTGCGARVGREKAGAWGSIQPAGLFSGACWGHLSQTERAASICWVGKREDHKGGVEKEGGTKSLGKGAGGAGLHPHPSRPPLPTAHSGWTLRWPPGVDKEGTKADPCLGPCVSMVPDLTWQILGLCPWKRCRLATCRARGTSPWSAACLARGRCYINVSRMTDRQP